MYQLNTASPGIITGAANKSSSSTEDAYGHLQWCGWSTDMLVITGTPNKPSWENACAYSLKNFVHFRTTSSQPRTEPLLILPPPPPYKAIDFQQPIISPRSYIK